MFKLLRRQKADQSNLLASQLYDQDTFYKAFIRDLGNCTNQVIIESPFITSRRMRSMLPVLQRLTKRGVRVIINTRNPLEHADVYYQMQAQEAVADLQSIDILVLYTAGHHRKVALLDNAIIWEGSLNILSHNDSCEIMRRTMSASLAHQMASFLKLEKYFLRQGGVYDRY
jgi:hypothetical protein